MLRWLFPVLCPFCGAVLREGFACPGCLSQLPRPSDTLLREKTLDTGTDVVFAAFLYEGKVRTALHDFKFRDKPEYTDAFSREMSKLVVGSWDLVTFAPMRYYHKNQRGYNQSELLARRIAKQLGLPCRSLLRKIRATRQQHELSAEKRENNLRGAFACIPLTEDERVLLVDDVITTGATMRELTNCLRGAGASAVGGLAYAVSPLIVPDEKQD